jgi:hypothetical protein
LQKQSTKKVSFNNKVDVREVPNRKKLQEAQKVAERQAIANRTKSTKKSTGEKPKREKKQSKVDSINQDEDVNLIQHSHRYIPQFDVDWVSNSHSLNTGKFEADDEKAPIPCEINYKTLMQSYKLNLVSNENATQKTRNISCLKRLWEFNSSEGIGHGVVLLVYCVCSHCTKSRASNTKSTQLKLTDVCVYRKKSNYRSFPFREKLHSALFQPSNTLLNVISCCPFFTVWDGPEDSFPQQMHTALSKEMSGNRQKEDESFRKDHDLMDGVHLLLTKDEKGVPYFLFINDIMVDDFLLLEARTYQKKLSAKRASKLNEKLYRPSMPPKTVEISDAWIGLPGNAGYVNNGCNGSTADMYARHSVCVGMTSTVPGGTGHKKEPTPYDTTTIVVKSSVFEIEIPDNRRFVLVPFGDWFILNPDLFAKKVELTSSISQLAGEQAKPTQSKKKASGDGKKKSTKQKDDVEVKKHSTKKTKKLSNQQSQQRVNKRTRKEDGDAPSSNDTDVQLHQEDSSPLKKRKLVKQKETSRITNESEVSQHYPAVIAPIVDVLSGLQLAFQSQLTQSQLAQSQFQAQMHTQMQNQMQFLELLLKQQQDSQERVIQTLLVNRDTSPLHSSQPQVTTMVNLEMDVEANNETPKVTTPKQNSMRHSRPTPTKLVRALPDTANNTTNTTTTTTTTTTNTAATAAAAKSGKATPSPVTNIVNNGELTSIAFVTRPIPTPTARTVSRTPAQQNQQRTPMRNTNLTATSARTTHTGSSKLTTLVDRVASIAQNETNSSENVNVVVGGETRLNMTSSATGAAHRLLSSGSGAIGGPINLNMITPPNTQGPPGLDLGRFNQQNNVDIAVRKPKKPNTS